MVHLSPGVLSFSILPFTLILISHRVYTYLSDFILEHKRRAWIITSVSSILMSLCSLPYITEFLYMGLEVSAIRRRPLLSTMICGSFQGFLLSDLIIGSREYPQFLGAISGWAHHLLYSLIMPYVVYRGWAHFFCICLVMELPTSLLSISHLYPKLRHDILTATVFFFTRILLHLLLIFLSVSPKSRDKVVGGSYIPAFLLISAFLMHALWFFSSVKGIRRRNKAGKLYRAEDSIREGGQK